MCSQPISSPVSLEHAAAPSATKLVERAPMAGFAVRPLVPSEPPQIVPTTSSDAAISACASRRRCSVGVDPGRPGGDRRSRVPPCSWITTVSTGRPESRDAFARARRGRSPRSRAKPAAPRRHWDACTAASSCCGVAIGIAAGEADHLDLRGCGARRDLARRRDARIRRDRRRGRRCGCPCGRRCAE